LTFLTLLIYELYTQTHTDTHRHTHTHTHTHTRTHTNSQMVEARSVREKAFVRKLQIK
jgi:hypothetical protein